MEKLTNTEEEVMIVIWQSGNGFIKDFLEKMPEPKPPYTTLASIVKNLEKKGYLISEKAGNSWFYKTLVPEKDYKRKFMSGFVSNYFSNSYKEMVSFFAKEQKLSSEDLKEILSLIEEQKNKEDNK
ncbi:MAG: BlaI/MecI/CopY family transcriptional regulator [Bacteroidales bacterium]|nr:BlaI/MecI/CopY family transcriptional regulator [Bacteroidales bacterium]